MLEKTQGIVLSFIRYKETSIITRIYTKEFGLQSYLVNGVRSRRSKTGMAFFQPLTLLDLVVYHKESKSLKRLSEIKCLYPCTSSAADYRKAAICAFINELLVKTLKEEAGDPDLFQYVSEQLMLLDKDDFNPDFPFTFALGLSAHLGFFPEEAEQMLVHSKGPRDAMVVSYVNSWIKQAELAPVKVSREVRRKALQMIVDFFSWHIESFGKLNSLQILQEVYG